MGKSGKEEKKRWEMRSESRRGEERKRRGGGSLTVEKRGKIFAKRFLPVHKGPIGRVL